VADCGGSDHKRAIGNGFGNGFEFFGAGQNIRGIHGGAGALKCHIVGIHHAQMAKSEVAHRPRGRADVQGIACVHQDNAQMIEFSRNRQSTFILRQHERNWSEPFSRLGKR